MKKYTIVFLAIIAILSITINVYAEDKLLTTKIKSINVSFDKNGNEFVRALIGEQRNIQGVAYEADLAIMFFGPVAQQAKQLQPGQEVKLVVSENNYRGNKGYIAHAIVNKK